MENEFVSTKSLGLGALVFRNNLYPNSAEINAAEDIIKTRIILEVQKCLMESQKFGPI